MALAMSAASCHMRSSKLASASAPRRLLPAALPSARPFSPLGTRRAQPVARALGSQDDEQKKLTRENEPEEYWTSAAERKGESPFKDPLAIIGILAILSPFVILGIAIGTGFVDVNAGR